ncbi:MAG: hypothetical protein GX028_02345 [Clostridiaceae bacterium]|nr:hypothetical protein [Clostridiaceae bacterium]
MKQFGIMVGLDKPAAFEGWFCKIDDRKNDIIISVIWGYSTNAKSRHAFIQFQDSIKHRTSYVRYSIDELSWTEDPFVLNIGKNQLSQSGMHLDIDTEEIVVQGEFSFSGFSQIKTSFLKPNIMGWLSFLPNECNHSITSMKHEASGNLQINDQSWKIESADAYMEKDWGRGFPSQYVWAQANDWVNSSFVFSYASVPMLGKFKKGFLMVLQHEGQEYRFTTIEGGRMIDFSADDDSFTAVIKKGRLKMSIHAKQTHPVPLASPDNGEMKAKIKESIDGDIEIVLQENGKKIIELKTQRASIDVHF